MRSINGGLAQLARVLAWQARGHRFESGNLHKYLRKSSILYLYTAFFVSIKHRLGYQNKIVVMYSNTKEKANLLSFDGEVIK